VETGSNFSEDVRMNHMNIFARFYGFLISLIFGGHGKVSIQVRTGDEWETHYLDGPITFSELDDRYGKGNWAL